MTRSGDAKLLCLLVYQEGYEPYLRVDLEGGDFVCQGSWRWRVHRTQDDAAAGAYLFGAADRGVDFHNCELECKDVNSNRFM